MFVCKEHEARISALIDDELTAEERIEVLEHMAQCPACKAYWEDLLSVRDALREEMSAPAGLADAVMARVHETAQDPAAKKTVRFPHWKRYVGLAACCALVAIGVWMADALPMPMQNMDTAAVRNGAAPESASQNDCAEDSVIADTDVGTESYSYSDDADTAACDTAPEAPEDSGTGAYGNTDSFVAMLTTGSTVAEDWVKNTLGEEWSSGRIYTLTGEQYLELYKLLSSSGESFTEIIGNYDSGSYQLLAE